MNGNLLFDPTPFPSQVNRPDFEHVHMVRDLTCIHPTDSLKGFQSGTKIVLPIVREY